VSRRPALPWDGSSSTRTCRHCGARSVAGLRSGVPKDGGYCKYHWFKVQHGKEWADKAFPGHPEADPATTTTGEQQ
jgi:hypothetical protein